MSKEAPCLLGGRTPVKQRAMTEVFCSSREVICISATSGTTSIPPDSWCTQSQPLVPAWEDRVLLIHVMHVLPHPWALAPLAKKSRWGSGDSSFWRLISIQYAHNCTSHCLPAQSDPGNKLPHSPYTACEGAQCVWEIMLQKHHSGKLKHSLLTAY